MLGFISSSRRLMLATLVHTVFLTAPAAYLAAQTAPTFPPPEPPITDPHTLAVSHQIAADMAGFGPALHNRDFTYFEKVWAPELLVNSPGNKVLTRSQVIASLKEGKLDYRDTHTIAESFFTVGDNAVEMGHEDYVPLTGPEAGKTLYRRYTNFYLHRDGRWVLLARQATIYDPTVLHYVPITASPTETSPHR